MNSGVSGFSFHNIPSFEIETGSVPNSKQSEGESSIVSSSRPSLGNLNLGEDLHNGIIHQNPTQRVSHQLSNAATSLSKLKTSLLKMGDANQGEGSNITERCLLTEDAAQKLAEFGKDVGHVDGKVVSRGGDLSSDSVTNLPAGMSRPKRRSVLAQCVTNVREYVNPLADLHDRKKNVQKKWIKPTLLKKKKSGRLN